MIAARMAPHYVCKEYCTKTSASFHDGNYGALVFNPEQNIGSFHVHVYFGEVVVSEISQHLLLFSAMHISSL